MYSINGISLDNEALGWRLRAPSKPLSGIVRQLQTQRGRRDGVVPLPADFDAVSLTLVVKTARVRLEPLYALFAAPTLMLSMTGVADRSALVELVSASPQGRGHAEAVVDATFVLRVPGVFWRAAEATETAALTSASQVMKCLAARGGISAPVGDAMIRVKGAVTGLQVSDSGGSWFTFDAIAANEYLRFHAESGRAFITSGDVWTGGVEASGRVDFGGPRGRFEITPAYPNPLDPTVREGRLVIASTTRSSAAVQVRARPAHLI